MRVLKKSKCGPGRYWLVASMTVGAIAIWFVAPAMRSDFIVAELVHSVQRDRKVILTVPRRAIYFIDPMGTFSRWSSHLTELTSLGFAVVFPNGDAYGDVFEESYRFIRADSPQGNQLISVDIHVVGRDIYLNIPVSVAKRAGWPGQRRLPDYDGLKSFGNRSEDAEGNPIPGLTPDMMPETFFLPTSDADNFDLIRCNEQSENANFLCRYSVRVNDKVLLEASFVDFRFHGGRKFANGYMRLILQKYCEYDRVCDWREGAPFRKQLLPIDD